MTTVMGIFYRDLPLHLIILACHHGCQCRGDDIDDLGYCQNWCSPWHYCGTTRDYIIGIDCRGCYYNKNDLGKNVFQINSKRFIIT